MIDMNVAQCKYEKKRNTRALILLFLLCLLFDGIFRKWILPSFSSQIMALKQIIAVLICIMNIGLYTKMSSWEKSFFFVGTMTFITTLLFGHQNLMVALYGCLPFWFGLPLCYIISKKIRIDDLYLYIKIVIYTSIIHYILMIVQFMLPPSHFLNFRGGEVDARIADLNVSELAGMFRPCGIFVHSTHSNLFMTLAFVFILYCLFINKSLIPKSVLWISLTLSAFACVCSASRTCIMLYVGVLLYFLVFILGKKNRRSFYKLLVILSAISFALILSPLGKTALDNIGKRFDIASEVQNKGKSTTIEGTISDIWNRTIVYNVEAIVDPHTLDGNTIPFWGYGQGLSTQVGGKMTGEGKKHSGFALAEWDGLRIMCESGYIFGWLIIYIRMGYVLRFMFRLPLYKRKNNYVALCLYFPFFLSFFLLMTWGNLFMANFAFFVGGLFLATLQMNGETTLNMKLN